MKLFSKCPYTLDNRVRTSLHTYSIRNRTAAIQPCRTPHRTQPRTPNPVTSIVHMSRSHLKCHCLGWFLPWMEKNTRRLILILWIIMKNPVCPPCIKLKLYIHKKGHTHKFIYIYTYYTCILMTSANIVPHGIRFTTIHLNELLQVAVAIINAASMQKTTWVTDRTISFQKHVHPIKRNNLTNQTNLTVSTGHFWISSDYFFIFDFQLWHENLEPGQPYVTLQACLDIKPMTNCNSWNTYAFHSSTQPHVDTNCTSASVDCVFQTTSKTTSSKMSSPSVNKPVEKTSILNLDLTTLLSLAVMGFSLSLSGDAPVSIICSQNTMKNLALLHQTSMKIRVDTVEYIMGINGHAWKNSPFPPRKHHAASFSWTNLIVGLNDRIWDDATITYSLYSSLIIHVI